ncbi:MAG: sensor histidine kinase [Bradymonadales bacterium]|nr:MAG: sensor histidine kinase [Bradymonadales bacterium]
MKSYFFWMLGLRRDSVLTGFLLALLVVLLAHALWGYQQHANTKQLLIDSYRVVGQEVARELGVELKVKNDYGAYRILSSSGLYERVTAVDIFEPSGAAFWAESSVGLSDFRADCRNQYEAIPIKYLSEVVGTLAYCFPIQVTYLSSFSIVSVASTLVGALIIGTLLLLWFVSQTNSVRCLIGFIEGVDLSRPGSPSRLVPRGLSHEIQPVYLKIKALLEKLDEEMQSAKMRERELAIVALSKEVAHDILSPLATLKAVKQSLQETALDSELEEIFSKSLERISKISKTLLDQSLGRFEGVPIDVWQVSSRVIREFKLKYGHWLKVSIEGSEKVSLANGEELGLERVLTNLLNNSVESFKEDHEEALVRISIATGEKFVVLRVQDNGPGVPEAVKEKLGQKQITYGKERGHGLGVYSAAAMLKRWGGRLTFESQPNWGTIAIVQLRRANKK